MDGQEAGPSGRVIVVMGAAGAGKTTIGRHLADALGWQFYDGDDLHPSGNIDKMAGGSPLTDDDRARWLELMRNAVATWVDSGARVVLAASLLRAAYRSNVLGPERRHVRLVYLRATPALLAQRLAHRTGHFMRGSLLASQLAILEEPEEAVVVDAAESPDTIVRRIRHEIVEWIEGGRAP